MREVDPIVRAHIQARSDITMGHGIVLTLTRRIPFTAAVFDLRDFMITSFATCGFTNRVRPCSATSISSKGISSGYSACSSS